MGFPRKLNINPKTSITASHTLGDIFDMSPGKPEQESFSRTHVFGTGEPDYYFNSAINQETGHECKYESSQNRLSTGFGSTEHFNQIIVELRANEIYHLSKYEAVDATDEEINLMTNDAKTTFDRWCAAIGAIPPETPPSPPVKKEVPTPTKPQNPMDDEIQF